MSARCPRCGSDQVRGAKFDQPDGTLREFGCMSCGLVEDRRSDAADLAEWLARWQPPALPAGPRRAMTPDELLEQIVRRPDDDAPRLAYADAMAGRQPERAELIRLQIERFHDEARRGVRFGEPGAREQALLAEHGPRWGHFIAPYARAHRTDAKFQGYEFERGFVALLRAEPDMVADMGDRLVNMAPIEHLDLTREGPFAPALTARCLGQMRSLGFDNLGLTDDDVIALAERGHLGKCQWLDLSSNRITARGVEALLANPVIRAMKGVLLFDNPGNPHVLASQDVDGTILNEGLPDHALAAEKRYGRVDWLHLVRVKLPDRFHPSAVRPLP